MIWEQKYMEFTTCHSKCSFGIAKTRMQDPSLALGRFRMTKVFVIAGLIRNPPLIKSFRLDLSSFLVKLLPKANTVGSEEKTIVKIIEKISWLFWDKGKKMGVLRNFQKIIDHFSSFFESPLWGFTLLSSEQNDPSQEFVVIGECEALENLERWKSQGRLF